MKRIALLLLTCAAYAQAAKLEVSFADGSSSLVCDRSGDVTITVSGDVQAKCVVREAAQPHGLIELPPSAVASEPPRDVSLLMRTGSVMYVPGAREGTLSARKAYAMSLPHGWSYVALTGSTGNVDQDHHAYRMAITNRPVGVSELAAGKPQGVSDACYKDGWGKIYSSKCNVELPAYLVFIPLPDNPSAGTGVCGADDQKCRVQIEVR